ncbi:FtsX-like permease family protein [Streptomyces violascens]|uniref:Membrane protein n=1 Tax=Streptomyces violascens TaxID=67381 RepID=A0ABQ3QN80_9ACTN|nr:FtsX-like permease family protein [Streptomyces violascens]GGU34945.1 membrane protein [Streptomyces violascens]GHI38734.1 membrane protein [Streptomyces violascens]
MSGTAVAPWVRTRLRTAPGAAAALALLVLLTAWLAAAYPRAIDTYEDDGLRRAVATAAPGRTALQFAAGSPGLALPDEQRAALVSPHEMQRRFESVVNNVPAPLTIDRSQSAYGLRTTQKLESDEPFLARPYGLPPRLTVATQSDLAAHARVVSGRLPSGSADQKSAEAEGAVTTATAKTLNIKAGSVLHVATLGGPRLAFKVTGIVEPLLPEAGYWSVLPVLRTPQLLSASSQPDPPKYWHGGLLLAPGAAPALLATDSKPETYAQLAPSSADLNARQFDGLKASVAGLQNGPALSRIRTSFSISTSLYTELDRVLLSYATVRDSITPVVAVAGSGTATVAAVVLLMAGGLAAARRTAELALLRARGGSLRQIAGRLLAESAVVVVPAAALGLLLAVLAVPHGRLGPALAAAGGVAALGCLALPVRAALTHRTVRSAAERADLVQEKPSARRTVAELTLLVLAAGAVFALRRRGTGGGPADSLVSAAPVLVGVIAAFVLIRLYPLPLRWAARPAARLRSTVAFLSLARAGRASGGGVLPLLALLTALTTAAFGGSVLAGADDARDRAALYATGTDARIDSDLALPKDLPGRIARVPGVHGVSPVHIEYAVRLPDDDTTAVAGVDPTTYAALTAGTALGVPADRLKAPAAAPGKAVLPAVASPSVARRLGKEPVKLRVAGYDVTIRVVAAQDGSAAVPSSDFILVDTAGLGAKDPTALLVGGTSIDAKALRKTAVSGHVSVRLQSEARREFADSPLQSGAGRIYAAAVAAGAGLAVLALLLSLLRGAPERSALLARLRTMGLTRRQGRTLLVLEALPPAFLAAAGGALTGWASIVLLAPGIDLAGLALATSSGLAPVGSELRADPLSLLLPAVCVVLLAAGVATAQAWWSGRRGSITELRAGDAR